MPVVRSYTTTAGVVARSVNRAASTWAFVASASAGRKAALSFVATSLSWPESGPAQAPTPSQATTTRAATAVYRRTR